ncbi:hypothetical protein HBI56_081110 [Parastagonospora nodorum]|nr:hypothetical protein HBH56_105580 [Parastagonospora nodorum]KAH3929171.1 hypothetical protein HBH54_124830 [Parastagonospora nodorum]KAH3951314.1 hypothetical protein HBH53_058830 [Parastagonospora nodorum]KAH3975357.1 hypothetical protein HBH52_128040 [Parastagonospora nodorum]KAH3978694.1 hypothetical protein HBH51_064960 [Parastagonospora nodorum]
MPYSSLSVWSNVAVVLYFLDWLFRFGEIVGSQEGATRGDVMMGVVGALEARGMRQISRVGILVEQRAVKAKKEGVVKVEVKREKD